MALLELSVREYIYCFPSEYLPPVCFPVHSEHSDFLQLEVAPDVTSGNFLLLTATGVS